MWNPIPTSRSGLDPMKRCRWQRRPLLILCVTGILNETGILYETAVDFAISSDMDFADFADMVQLISEYYALSDLCVITYK